MAVNPEDEDLFAGFQVSGELVQGNPLVSTTDAGKVDNSDLFAGLAVGNQIVPAPQQSVQDRARELGAQPGMGITPQQKQQMVAGQQIQQGPRMLDENRDYRPNPQAEGQPFVESTAQGMMNVGGGFLRAYGELSKALGKDGAEQFVQELLTSQSMEQEETNQVTEGHPVQKFGGEVFGETVALPYGGGGAGVLRRVAESAAMGALGGGLSAGGRGEDASGVTGEALLGGAAGPFFEGVSALNKGRRLRKEADQLQGASADKESISTAADNVQEAQTAIEETGTKLLPAQQTLDPYQLETQAFIGQNPEVSRKAFDVLKQQNREAAEAVGKLLHMIAPPELVGSAGASVRKASEKIIKSAEDVRARKVEPDYTRAWAETPPMAAKDTTALIDEILKDLPDKGEMKSAVLHAKGLIGNGEVPLRKLHHAKIEIDQMLAGGRENGVGKTTGMYLEQIRKSLLAEMDNASPAYKQARDKFSAASPKVDALKDGVFGRLANLNDTQLKQASGILFDAAETNPEVMTNALKALKGVRGGHEVIRGLLRTELEKRLGRMRVDLDSVIETGGRKLENVPALLLSNLFGNAKQKKLLMTALEELGPDAAKNARWLETTLSRASSGRPGGSQTGIRQVITDNLRGSEVWIRSLFKNPINTIADIGADASFSARVSAIGDALYNPDWSPDMKRIRGLSSEKANTEFGKLLGVIVESNEKLRLGKRAFVSGAGVSTRDEE